MTVAALLLITGCTLGASDKGEDSFDMSGKTIKLSANGYDFDVAMANTKAADELYEIVKESPITIKANEYGGWEKVGSLGRKLTTENREYNATKGDIMLYQGNQIVFFYGDNSWSYTPIGKAKNLENWDKALKGSTVDITLSL